ncbi:MAG: hypothetical protein LBK44_04380 [Spirochaetales bacterium]|nr:hypothetical protein [Spirochaetales bacterium]
MRFLWAFRCNPSRGGFRTKYPVWESFGFRTGLMTKRILKDLPRQVFGFSGFVVKKIVSQV